MKMETKADLTARIVELKRLLRRAMVELEYAPCRDAPGHTHCLKCQLAKDIGKTLGVQPDGGAA